MKRVRSVVEADYAHSRGVYGQQVGVCILDTGIVRNMDFGSRICYFQDFLYRRNRLYDDCGHGTHIAGIIAGSGEISGGAYMGMAPEANIIMLKVLDYIGNGTVGNVMAGLHWVLMNKEKYNIRVVNISVGTIAKEDGDEESQLVRAVNEVWDAGIVVCVAAGNNGPNPSSVTTPGISRKVITVGSSDNKEPVEVAGTMVADYSGRGPNASCIIKPDLVAPGSNVWSCKAYSRLGYLNGRQAYQKKSGTSMSTPVVSGACALLLSRYPMLNNVEVKWLLCESAADLGWESNRQGFGLLNVERLFKRADELYNRREDILSCAEGNFESEGASRFNG